MCFLLADMAERFHLLSHGLAPIVTFIEAKMLIMDLYKIPILWMLGTAFAILAGSMLASQLRTPTNGQTGGRTL